MGVDISLVIEYAYLNPATPEMDDLSFHGFSEVHLGRNSKFFALLAGVRSGEDPIVPPRGLPKNCSDLVKQLALIQILDEPPVGFPNLNSLNSEYKVVHSYYGYPVDVKDKKPEKDHNSIFSREGKEFDKKSNLFLDSNNHSHSWLVLNELTEVYAKVAKDLVYDSEHLEDTSPYGSEAILNTMRALEKEDEVITRIVFWFNG
jgi:hypothetical protein